MSDKTQANLTMIARPTPFPTTLLPLERRIYSVVAAVTLVRSEADQDLHVVLEDGAAHMIAESPTAPACTVGATAYRRKQMADGATSCALARRRASSASPSGTSGTIRRAWLQTRSSCIRSSTSPASRASGVRGRLLIGSDRKATV